MHELTEMELRVATAIRESITSLAYQQSSLGVYLVPSELAAAARAAIRAMREPTNDMCEAYIDATYRVNTGKESVWRKRHHVKAVKRYAAMIDVASPPCD